MPASIRGRGSDGPGPPSLEDIERQAAEDLARAGGKPRPSAAPGGWSPPGPNQPLMPDPPAFEAQGDDGDDDTDYEEKEAVTELALSWLAEQDRPGGKRSLEDMVVRVDASSANAARDRALQAHLERRQMLEKAHVTPPWAQKKLTVGTPFSTRKKPLKKKAKKKKAPAKAAVARRGVPLVDADDLPIEGYDRLTVAQVLSVLDQLEDDDLDLLADYEEQNKNRAKILDAIDDLFDQPQAPPAKKAPAAKKKASAAKKAPAATKKDAAKKKAATKKTVAKKAVAEKAVPVEKAAPVDKAVAEKAAPAEVVAPVPEADDDLPIEAYDRLTAAQILSVLDELEDDDLELVADYEEQHQNRAEILDAIDDLLDDEEVPSVEVPPEPVKKAPAKKSAPAEKLAPGKKVAAKKASAKRSAAAKKVAAKKAPAKKVTADEANKVPAKKGRPRR